MSLETLDFTMNYNDFDLFQGRALIHEHIHIKSTDFEINLECTTL